MSVPEPERVLYVVEHPDGYYKIGVAKDLERRFKKIQLGSPYRLSFSTTIKVTEATLTESRLHNRLDDWHKRGEWFELPEEVHETLVETEHLTPEVVSYLF